MSDLLLEQLGQRPYRGRHRRFGAWIVWAIEDYRPRHLRPSS